MHASIKTYVLFSFLSYIYPTSHIDKGCVGNEGGWSISGLPCQCYQLFKKACLVLEQFPNWWSLTSQSAGSREKKKATAKINRHLAEAVFNLALWWCVCGMYR